MTKYWPHKHGHVPQHLVDLELRAHLAWILIERGVVKSEVAENCVKQAFALADAFMTESESRKDVKRLTPTDIDAAYKEIGRLIRLQNKEVTNEFGDQDEE